MEKICPARAKDRIPYLAPPAAAPCSLNRCLLLQELSRLSFYPRGAVRWSLRLRGWCRMCKTIVNTHLLQVRTRQRFRRPQVYSGAGPSRLPSLGGVHPIGGTAVPPVLVVSRRGDFKGGREIEIPPTFDGSLVTFCPHRKLLARWRNIPIPPSCLQLLANHKMFYSKSSRREPRHAHTAL